MSNQITSGSRHSSFVISGVLGQNDPSNKTTSFIDKCVASYIANNTEFNQEKSVFELIEEFADCIKKLKNRQIHPKHLENIKSDILSAVKLIDKIYFIIEDNLTKNQKERLEIIIGNREFRNEFFITRNKRTDQFLANTTLLNEKNYDTNWFIKRITEELQFISFATQKLCSSINHGNDTQALKSAFAANEKINRISKYIDYLSGKTFSMPNPENKKYNVLCLKDCINHIEEYLSEFILPFIITIESNDLRTAFDLSFGLQQNAFIFPLICGFSQGKKSLDNWCEELKQKNTKQMKKIGQLIESGGNTAASVFDLDSFPVLMRDKIINHVNDFSIALHKIITIMKSCANDEMSQKDKTKCHDLFIKFYTPIFLILSECIEIIMPKDLLNKINELRIIENYQLSELKHIDKKQYELEHLIACGYMDEQEANNEIKKLDEHKVILIEQMSNVSLYN